MQSKIIFYRTLRTLHITYWKWIDSIVNDMITGILLASYFSRLESSMIFITVYNSVALYLSGAYLSLAWVYFLVNKTLIIYVYFIKPIGRYACLFSSSLSKWIYSLRFFSIFFLSCETGSVGFWAGIKSLREYWVVMSMIISVEMLV